MIKLFKKKKQTLPTLQDLNGEELMAEDKVISYRYELGECTLTLEEGQYFYVPIQGGQKVSYLKMVDAITGFQKVTKVKDQ